MHTLIQSVIAISLAGDSARLSDNTVVSINVTAELQCSEPGWMASSAGRGFVSRPFRHVESGFCML